MFFHMFSFYFIYLFFFLADFINLLYYSDVPIITVQVLV